jgi:pimeloyl-ACP methyl ester carboxylesterase
VVELSLGGVRVSAGTGGRDWQSGLPTVVLLHGAGMDHTVWALQARGLAHHGRNVLALDLAGHGGSAGPARDSIAAMAQWVLQAIDAAGIGAFRIAGHSMGALIALETAALAGARAEALALVGFAPEMRVHPDLIAAARAGDHAALEMMVSWSLGMIGMCGANPAPGLSCAGAALRLLERARYESLAADFTACDAYRGAAAAAARIGAPVLLLLGAEDRMTPTAPAIAFARLLPQARTEVLTGIGHLLPIEAPVPVLAALKAIL